MSWSLAFFQQMLRGHSCHRKDNECLWEKLMEEVDSTNIGHQIYKDEEW